MNARAAEWLGICIKSRDLVGVKGLTRAAGQVHLHVNFDYGRSTPGSDWSARHCRSGATTEKPQLTWCKDAGQTTFNNLPQAQKQIAGTKATVPDVEAKEQTLDKGTSRGEGSARVPGRVLLKASQPVFYGTQIILEH